MRYMLSALFGAGLSVISTCALAEQPAWVPDGIVLPEGHVMLSDRSIGSSTHMLKAEVEQDPADLLQVWADDLGENGLQVDTDAIEEGRILFSGPGGMQGQVVATKAFEAEGYTIEIDMSGG